MTSLVLEFTNSSGKQIRSWVRNFEVLVVGKGIRSDVVCDFDTTMADQHFQITVSEMAWVVRLLAPYPAQLYVNGHLITAWEHELEDGDTIQAGSTEFSVTIEGAGKKRSDADSREPETPLPNRDEIPIKWQPHESCPVCVSVEWQTDRMTQVLQLLTGQDCLVASVNQVQLGWSVRGLEPKGEDLFRSAPEEIRATDSLQLEAIAADMLDERFTALVAGMKGNGVCLLVTAKPLEELIAAKRSVWAWFARPENLKFHLLQGSDYLRNMILSDLVCIVLGDRKRPDRWELFALEDKQSICRERLEQAILVST